MELFVDLVAQTELLDINVMLLGIPTPLCSFCCPNCSTLTTRGLFCLVPVLLEHNLSLWALFSGVFDFMAFGGFPGSFLGLFSPGTCPWPYFSVSTLILVEAGIFSWRWGSFGDFCSNCLCDSHPLCPYIPHTLLQTLWPTGPGPLTSQFPLPPNSVPGFLTSV